MTRLGENIENEVDWELIDSEEQERGRFLYSVQLVGKLGTGQVGHEALRQLFCELPAQGQKPRELAARNYGVSQLQYEAVDPPPRS